ncbi:pimeloyl-ACP methyl ester carboxylesterase [Paenibacillus cellulosilyticus]|uniref:Pimeloyl-ACP methyl ester carboxylesterase n=1 Tax=Paenibacillus cellulosilyticus TaxID=375489 RepID=A0A2V2YY09_9BACL|nr:alpha/beta fold hydrolase [Paenibacillus cellulosilyticus]PWW05180.1 pimeloyl-ACP methyl ester carboxylesterase [Paenibacillus cellulosilyticus]QKS43508.1 alpha/beta hydrolase [Paenibacillus cellulosilyticus]
MYTIYSGSSGIHHQPKYKQQQSQQQHQASPVQPLTFVLVHGSWADASFWNPVAAELRAKGHVVYIPEYPGHGGDLNTNVTHGMISKAVADYMTANNLQDIILVGHSFGGSVIQKAAEQVPDRIKRLVFMNAFVLADGQSVADQFPPPMLQAFEQLRKASKDDTIMLPFPVFRETFVNVADLALAKQLYSEARPEPAKPAFERLDLKQFYKLSTPRSYLYLTEDNVLPQGEGYGWHPHMSSRLGLFRLIKSPGDHMTYFRSKPALLAQRLYEAARD